MKNHNRSIYVHCLRFAVGTALASALAACGAAPEEESTTPVAKNSDAILGIGDSPEARLAREAMIRPEMPESLKQHIRETPIVRAEHVARTYGPVTDTPPEYKFGGLTPHFRIHTACVNNAGTDANVQVWIHDTRGGWIGGWLLDHPNFDDFEKCTYDEFTLPNDVIFVENTDRLWIQHDNSGNAAAWKVDGARMDQIRGTSSVYLGDCPVNQWLGNGNPTFVDLGCNAS